MPEIAELAKSARSSCKKCKEKIEKGALRLGKQYDDANGHTMTSWYHPQCWKPGKDGSYPLGQVIRYKATSYKVTKL